MAATALKTHAENVTAIVLSSCLPGRDYLEIRQWLTDQSRQRRTALTFGVIGSLAALAGVAAAFGPEGLAVYFAVVLFLAW